jgi:hypothetical protein
VPPLHGHLITLTACIIIDITASPPATSTNMPHFTISILITEFELGPKYILDSLSNIVSAFLILRT